MSCVRRTWFASSDFGSATVTYVRCAVRTVHAIRISKLYKPRVESTIDRRRECASVRVCVLNGILFLLLLYTHFDHFKIVFHSRFDELKSSLSWYSRTVSSRIIASYSFRLSKAMDTVIAMKRLLLLLLSPVVVVVQFFGLSVNRFPFSRAFSLIADNALIEIGIPLLSSGFSINRLPFSAFVRGPRFVML